MPRPARCAIRYSPLVAIQITQPKISSLAPSWHRFRGATILFASLGFEAPPSDMAASGGDEPAGSLFAELGAFVGALKDDPWRLSHGLCPLPVGSYHVTFADLVHDGNFCKLPAAMRACFGGDGIVAGAEYPEPLADAVRKSGLLSVPATTFRPDGLVVMNRSALVLTLRARNRAAFAAALIARERLSVTLADAFGVTLQPFLPHVSLGYFANKQCAASAEHDVAEMGARLLPGLRNRGFTFAPPAPYVFTDMATYRRIDCSKSV